MGFGGLSVANFMTPSPLTINAQFGVESVMGGGDGGGGLKIFMSEHERTDERKWGQLRNFRDQLLACNK